MGAFDDADTSLLYDRLGIGFSLETHLASAQEYLIGYVTGWGNGGPTGTVIRSADLGNIDKSITGIAIGPNSDVDFVELQYQLPTKNRYGGRAINTAIAAVGRPLIAAIPGPSLKLNAVPVDSQGAYGDRGLFGDEFYKEGTDNISNFGAALGIGYVSPISTNSRFKIPTLEVILSFGDPKLDPSWGQARPPKMWPLTVTYPSSVDAEQTLMVVPVFGRSYAQITLQPFTNDVFDLRLAEVIGYERVPGAGGMSNPIETQKAPGAYPATVHVEDWGKARWDIPLSKNASWLVLYGTPRVLNAAITGTIVVGD